MLVHRLSLAVFFLLAIVAPPVGSWADTITVDIGPGICTLSGSSPLNIATTCGNITISGNAQVQGTETGNIDYFKLSNTTITANQPVTDLHLVFSREFVPGPSTAAGPPIVNVYYKTSAGGSFSPTTQSGKPVNSFTLRSTVTDVVTSTSQEMFLQSTSTGTGNTSISLGQSTNTIWHRPPELVGNRILKGDMWFTLNNINDKINLINVIIQNKAAAGGDGSVCRGDVSSCPQTSIEIPDPQ